MFCPTFFVGGFFPNSSSISSQVHLQAICAAVLYWKARSAAHTRTTAVCRVDLRRERAVHAG
jgi:hypothetical protein